MNDATFQRTLQSVLFDNKYDRFVAKRRSGKLNTKGLSKIGYSDKIFKKREERQNKEYSIALVVDCSGSMNGSRIAFATDAANKLSKHLSSAKINHAVYTYGNHCVQLTPFTTKYDRQIPRKFELVKEGDIRIHWKCDVPIEDRKGWRFDKYTCLGLDYDFAKNKRISIKGSNDTDYVGGGTATSIALEKVNYELSKESGKKIMIILSDGDYNECKGNRQAYELPKKTYDEIPQDLKKIVVRIIKSGIEVHSIGIQTDGVNRYYPPERTCAIYDLAQLYDHIIKIIRLNLKRG